MHDVEENGLTSIITASRVYLENINLLPIDGKGGQSRSCPNDKNDLLT